MTLPSHLSLTLPLRRLGCIPVGYRLVSSVDLGCSFWGCCPVFEILDPALHFMQIPICSFSGLEVQLGGGKLES